MVVRCSACLALCIINKPLFRCMNHDVLGLLLLRVHVILAVAGMFLGECGLGRALRTVPLPCRRREANSVARGTDATDRLLLTGSITKMVAEDHSALYGSIERVDNQ